MLRLSPSPAFSEHLQRSLGAGLSGGADPKDARHRCREPADPAVLHKVMHGFQGEKQVGASLICLQIFAYLVKAGAGALLGKRFLKEEGVISGPAERVSTTWIRRAGLRSVQFFPATQAAL